MFSHLSTSLTPPCHFRLVTNHLILNYLPIILGSICAEDYP